MRFKFKTFKGDRTISLDYDTIDLVLFENLYNLVLFSLSFSYLGALNHGLQNYSISNKFGQ